MKLTDLVYYLNTYQIGIITKSKITDMHKNTNKDFSRVEAIALINYIYDNYNDKRLEK